MAQIRAEFVRDLRDFVPKIKKHAKNKVVMSTRDPAVKTEIHYSLLEQIQDRIPVDTGALAMSPYTRGGSQNMGVSKYKSYQTYYNMPRFKFAHGNTNEKGITFDPYSVTGEHYATKVKDFDPMRWINANKRKAYPAIRKAIVRGIKDNGIK